MLKVANELLKVALDSKAREQKIKDSWEMINNPQNALLQKAFLQCLSQLPKDSSEARNIRANLNFAEKLNQLRYKRFT